MNLWDKLLGRISEKPQETVVGIVGLCVVASVFFVGGAILIRRFTDQKPVKITTPISKAVAVSPYKDLIAAETGGKPPAASLETNLSSKSSSGFEGTAHFDEFNGKLMVSLELKGTKDGDTYPAFVYQGSCDDVGTQLYSLSPVENGRTDNYLIGTLADFKKQFPLSIRIFHLPQQGVEMAACSDLRAS